MTAVAPRAGTERAVWGRPIGRRSSRLILVLVFALTLACSIALVLVRDAVAGLNAWGYAGAFLLAALGNASVFIPFPWLFLVAPLGSTLSTVWVVVWAATGATAGAAVLYGIGGTVPRRVIPGWLERRGRATRTLIVAALALSPVASYPTLAGGTLRVPLIATLGITFVSEALKVWLAVNAITFGLRLFGT